MLNARIAEFTDAGFNGSTVLAELDGVPAEDKHLRECFPTVGHLANYLDLFFISTAANLLEQRASPAQMDALFNESNRATYEMRPFRKIALCHLFNFDTQDNRLEFDGFRVERLDATTIAQVLGELSTQPFLHPPNVGDYFVVFEETGPCDDVVSWLDQKATEAGQFAQVLQYFRDGIVPIDYTAPHFLPYWVNQI